MLVPRTIHFIWGGPPMPDHLRENLTRWRDLHENWDVILWGDDNLDWLEHRDLFDAAPSLVPADAVWQLRSDIARYEILLKHGGLYVDVDTYPLRNIEPALEGHGAWAAMENQRFIGNTYVACTPGHPVMQAIVNGLRESIRRNRGKRPNHMTGPRYVTPIWVEHGAYAAPSSQFFPLSYMQARRGQEMTSFNATVYAVHRFQHVRDLMKAGTQ